MATVRELLRMPNFYLKILELVVTIICVALVADEWYVAMSPSKAAVVNGTLVGFMMMLIVIIFGIVLDIPLHRTLILIITLPGAVLYIASGAIMMEAWVKSSRTWTGEVLASGILAFLNGLVYLADFGLTYFKYR